MRIALVNPPISAAEQYGSMKDLAPELPLLGIAFLSTYVKRHGFDVDLLDLAGTSPEESVNRLRDYDVIGFSSYITNHAAITKLASRLKSKGRTIIVGGPHATIFPTDFEASDVDYVVSGDGELPLAEILVAIRDARDPGPVSGIARREADGTLTLNGKAETINDLDLIGPPDVQKYDLSRYYPPVHIRGRKVIHTLFSRGCPYKCTFCAAAETMGRRVRNRSVTAAIDELKRYRDAGYDSVMFYDDIFTVSSRRVLDFCSALIKAGLKLKWTCFTRADSVKNKEMLAAMKEAGCYMMTFGCETANDKTLKLLQKGMTQANNVEGIAAAFEAGILTTSSFMIGLPGECEQDILRTISFARDSRLTFAVFPIFEPFRGTPVFDVCKRLGSWQRIEGDRNQLVQDQEEIWVPDGISRSEVVGLARRAFREFYFKRRRGIELARYLLFALPPLRTLRFLKGGASFFYGTGKKPRSQHNTHF